MKSLFFVLSLILCPPALAASSVTGLIAAKTDKVYLMAEGKCNSYLVKAETKEAAETLRLLADGDSLTATGLLEEETCTAKIDTVDFVGLKSILGYWYNEDHFVAVRNFNSLTFYSLEQMRPPSLKESSSAIQFGVEYRYSITPKSNSEWAIFLSDSNSTQLATLELDKNFATMKIYDSENGQLTKVLKLNKWDVPLK